MKNLFYYKNTRRIHYDTSNGTATITPINYSIQKSEVIKSYKFDGILGLLNISDGKYLFFVTESEEVGNLFDSKSSKFEKNIEQNNLNNNFKNTSNKNNDNKNFITNNKVYRIKKVKYISIEGIAKSESAKIVKNLLEEKTFYFTKSEIKEHFLWNNNLLKNFNLFIKKDKIIKNNKINLRSPFLFDNNINNDNNNINIDNNINTDNNFKNFILVHNPSEFPNYEFVNLFCGYFEQKEIITNCNLFENNIANKLLLEIKSFISINKIGPRMLSRGVDENGNTSFFVKTNFKIYSNKNILFNFKIYRGSIPLFWSQNDPLKPNKILFHKSENENSEAFKKHFSKIKSIDINDDNIDIQNNKILTNLNDNTNINNYNNINNKIIVVDLLSEKKYEKILSKMYKNNCVKNNIKYINFNLNNFTNNYEKMKDIFYKKLQKILKDINLILIDESGEESNQWDEISNESSNDLFNEDFDCMNKNNISDINNINNDISNINDNIIFRVNCLDCLDRTNICQFLIFNYFNPYRFESIKSMWKNNGNALSKMYTGSDALKGELSKEKKLTFVGRMNDIVISANRMINNKFTDKEKQKAIDLLLGKE